MTTTEAARTMQHGWTDLRAGTITADELRAVMADLRQHFPDEIAWNSVKLTAAQMDSKA